MTEQPDTTAIRAEISSRAHVCVNGTTAHELCDALDAARAACNESWDATQTQRRRAEAAEARITAALEWCQDAEDDGATLSRRDLRDLRSALTGDTPC